MTTQTKYNYLIDLARSLYDKPVGQNKHFTFILRRNKILSIGFNNYRKSHPLIKKYSSKEDVIYLHSEFDAINRFPHKPAELSRCTLVNVRLNRFGKVGQAKPCDLCSKLLYNMGINKIYWTNKKGCVAQ